VSALEAFRSWKYAKAQPTAAVRRVQSRSAVRPVATGACIAAMLLLVVPLITLEADARGGGGHGGGGHGAAFGGHGGGFGGHRGGIGLGARGGGGVRSFRAAHIGGARIGGAHVAVHSVRGSRFAGRSARIGGARTRDPAPRVFGNRAIANVALRSQVGGTRFHGGFFGSAWPWWRGGLVLGWFGPLFWPYVYYDFFDYVFWPYAYDDFWVGTRTDPASRELDHFECLRCDLVIDYSGPKPQTPKDRW